MLQNLRIVDFIEKTASKEPLPGGGSISALAGSLSAALAEMVAGLTSGKKGYEEKWDAMDGIAARAAEIRDRLAAAVDEDSNAYAEVLKAYALPRATDEEKRIRVEAVEAGLKLAASVPMSVAENSFSVLDLAETVVRDGNRNAVTDGAVGAMMARTAVLSAIFNVKTNLLYIKDSLFVESMSERIAVLEENVHRREKEILAAVKL